MALEFALKAGQLGSWEACRTKIPADRIGIAEQFYSGSKRLTICGGSKYGNVSLRLAHIACSDSAQAPPQAKRKKRIKADGPTKIELKLLKDLQEFIASCDLPPNEVPTTAELARNGRQDLANQVRRKGYKLVAKLLEQVRIAETGENTQTENVSVLPYSSVINKVSPNDEVELPSAKLDVTISNDVKEKNDVGSSNGGGFEGSPLPSTSAGEHANVNGYASHKAGVVGESLGDQSVLFPEVGKDHSIKGKPAGLALAEDFIQDVDQDRATPDDLHTSQPGDLLLGITDEGEGAGHVETDYETDDMEDNDNDDEYSEDDDDDSMHVPVRPNPNSVSPEDIAYHKAALLRRKLLQHFDSRSEELKQWNSFSNADTIKKKAAMQQDQAQTVLGPSGQMMQRRYHTSIECLLADCLQSDIQSQPTKKFEIQKELEQLKGLLHSKELELAEVSRQLEEAKLQGMLSLARAKTTAELLYMKQLAVEQDARLHAAERALSQMKQVHLEWWGEAGRVEVAGSFNGWQHNILLEPYVCSEIPKPGGGRGPMMWGTYLCFYSGVYEIKFIVDGNWQVDHRREVVMRDANQNNILRVE